MEKIWKINLIVIALIFLVIPLVSADWKFNNVKNELVIDKDTSEYGRIDIDDWYGLKKLMSLELKENTEVCNPEGCLAKQEIIMYEDGKLIDDIRFIDMETGLETTIKEYDLYVNGDIYNGEEVSGYSSGVTYNVELKGKVYPYQEVDWQVKSAGTDWITEWATWSSSLQQGTLAYYKFEDGSGKTAEDATGTYDLTSLVEGNWTTGKIDNAYAYNNSGTVVWNNTALTNTNPKNWTINFWTKFSDTYDVSRVLNKGMFANDRIAPDQIQLYFTGTGQFLLNTPPIAGDELYTTQASWTAGTWYMITVKFDNAEDNATIWVDGVLESSAALDGDKLVDGVGTGVRIGGKSGLDPANGSTIDEWSFHNRALSGTEIIELYNGGAGLGYGASASDTSVTLNAPDDNSETTNKLVTFNCTAVVDTATNVTNISLYHNETGTWTLNQTNSSITISNTSLFDVNFQNFVSIEWNCFACNNATTANCGYGTNRTISLKRMVINHTYNSSSYETSTETFEANVSTTNGTALTANLWYGGTSYAGTKTGTNYEAIFTRTLDIPTGIGNKTFYWEVSLGGIPTTNSTSVNQSIEGTNLSICGGDGGSIIYLNFTFIDETSGLPMNASNDLADFTYWLGSGAVTKSEIFTNTTDNDDYTFCAIPSDKTLNVDLSYKYSKTGYPQRTFAYDEQALSNTTTYNTLYLLASADGIYSTIVVQTAVGTGISGVLIQVERQFSGVWTLVGQQTSGSDGASTFWVNPNYQHRITATKTGFTSVQVTITPSQSTYTIIMGTGDTDDYNSTTEGITWFVYPGSGPLEPTTNQEFNVSVFAGVGGSTTILENCKFELLNSSNISQVLSSTTGLDNTTYCYLSTTYTTTSGQTIFGRLSVDTDESTGWVILNTDYKWILIDLDLKGWRTLTSFFSELRDLSEFGEGNEAEFNRVVLFFLVMTIIMGVFIYFSGIELTSPGWSIGIIWGIVLLASAGGFLTFESGVDNILPFFEQYGFFLILTCFAGGFWINSLRRTMDM